MNSIILEVVNVKYELIEEVHDKPWARYVINDFDASVEVGNRFYFLRKVKIVVSKDHEVIETGLDSLEVDDYVDTNYGERRVKKIVYNPVDCTKIYHLEKLVLEEQGKTSSDVTEQLETRYLQLIREREELSKQEEQKEENKKRISWFRKLF